MDENSGQSWSSWLQDVGGSLVKGYAQSQYQNPYELERMRIQARNADGYMYQEGQPMATSGGGISPTVLLIGGALLLAVVLVKA